MTNGEIEDLLVVGKIIPEMEIQGSGERRGVLVYFSRIPEANTELIIYPNDDLVELGKLYNLVINRRIDKPEINGKILFCQVYHELKREDDIMVKLSNISKPPRNEFMFKLHGYLGFLKRWGFSYKVYKHLQVGDYVKARVKSITPGKKDQLVHAVPLEKLVVTGQFP